MYLRDVVYIVEEMKSCTICRIVTFFILLCFRGGASSGSLQLLMSCDGDNVNFTRAYMKFISGNSFISFHLKNESWTLSNDQAEVIRRSLDPEYAQNAKTILQEECGYWNEQYARENHEREDNHSPQNTTAISSTLSEGTKKQFPSSDKEKSDDGKTKGGESDGAVIIVSVLVLTAICCICGVMILRQRNGAVLQQDFSLVPVDP